MFNDIIEGKDQSCSNCWWSTGGEPIAEVGKVYCSLYKKDHDDRYWCHSWRHRWTRAKETPVNNKPPKFKFNLKTK
jgi:hypothetical protein